MTIVPLGRITVTTAGTRVPITSSTDKCAYIVACPVAANTGTVVVGDTTVVAATGVGVYAELLKPASGYSDRVTIPSGEPDAGNTIDPSTIYLDAATSGDKVLVYLVRN